ncbi:uncharacterized protein [Littorina saxatilis]|uniref:uncharacterized protein isoform X2 n=1 Tax=Littorina saxatilis TaxID=31220 RepID=UPI0038B5B6A8
MLTRDRASTMASQQGGGGARPKTPRQGSGPTQQASAPAKEGWLFVQRKTLFGLVKWQKRRYCVLDGHSWLVIYKDRTKTNVEAVYLLQQILDVTATVPSSHVFEIRMTRDDPPLVLASRDQADMLDWMGALNGAISFANGPAPHEDVPSQGLTDPTTCQQPQARDTEGRTDPSTCQQPQARDTENMTDSSTCQQSGLSDAEREFLNAWFPNLHRDVYMIPPHHVDTVHVTKQHTQGGDLIDVLKTQQQIDSDSTKRTEVSDVVHIDRALKKVHCCMNKIKDKAESQKEVLIIMTQGKCGLYGAGSRSLYTGAAARSMNSDETEPSVLQEDLVLEEDFVDLLVIDRNRGVMMGAIIRQTEEDPHAVQEELRKAADYLQQAGDVVKRCVLGDLDLPQPAIHQAILLPHTTRCCLVEALQNMDDLQKLEQCLGVKAGQRVDKWCLCHDDMTDDTRRDAWWNTCWKGGKAGDPAMKGGSTYEKLVARFAVPLATVQVYLSRKPRLQLWTQGHFVQAVGEEHGRPMSYLALFPEQFEVLEHTPNNDDDDIRVFRGAPGVGKSIILILRGCYWMRKYRRTVFVLQTSDDGTAAAYLVRHQLSKTVGQGAGSVQLVNMAGVRKKNWRGQYKWTKGGEEKVQAWVEELCQHAQTEGRVHILADEANGDVITVIYKALKQRHITVSLWAAGVLLELPADMERYVHHLTQPLRSPPSVVREVEQADDMKGGKVPAYTAPPVAPPSDGPPVVRVDHLYIRWRHDTQGHEGDEPWRCERCGQLVADLLTTLRVGCHDHAPHGQGGLTFNDVFVLGGMNCDTDTTDDDSFSPAPFIRGLESRGVPTRKVAHNDTAAVRQLAEMTSAPTGEERAAGRGRDEAVTVAHQNTVWGLERPVVVYLDHLSASVEYSAAQTGRLRSMSRSTAQVIWVKIVTT